MANIIYSLILYHLLCIYLRAGTRRNSKRGKEMANPGDTATPAKQLAADTDIVSLDLPAPEGWRKKFTPKKGGTPKRNEIVFISPTGEDITNKRQLDQYLRSHPGGPPASEFDWGTGDTPRRSSRLSAKTKSTETPELEKPKKKERKLASKKGADDEAPEEVKDASANEVKKSADVQMEDAEGQTEKANEVDKNGDKAPEEVKDGDASEGKISADVQIEDSQGHAEKANPRETDTVEKKDENAEETPEDLGMLLPEDKKNDNNGANEKSMNHEGGQANHQPKASPVNC